MATKACRKCGVERDLETGFHAGGHYADGRHTVCKACRAPQAWARSELRRMGFDVCCKCKGEFPIADFHSDTSRTTGYSAYCKACAAEKCSLYNKANRKAQNDACNRWRYSTPARHLSATCRSRVGAACRKMGFRKSTKTADMLGCDWGTFADHLERHFEPGMSWENYGEWHIDHHIPLAVCYGAPAGEHWVEILFHWSNLRPMWGRENAGKNCRLPDEVFVP